MDDLGAISSLEVALQTDSGAAWRNALLAARLLKSGGAQLGGLWLKARAGGVRDAYLTYLKDILGHDVGWTRVPNAVSHAALLGSIDIPATAQTGRVVTSPGLLSRADEGVLLLPMAERIELATAAIIGSVMDTRTLPPPTARADMGNISTSAGFRVIAIDESASPEEHLAHTLSDRLGLVVDLNTVAWKDVTGVALEDGNETHADWHKVGLPVPLAELLSQIACAAGSSSLRSLRHLTVVSRMLAAFENRDSVCEADAVVAVRLCLGVQAEAQPMPEENLPSEDNPHPGDEACDAPQSDPSRKETDSDDRDRTAEGLDALNELLAAIEAGTVSGLPDLSARSAPRSGVSRTGTAGTPRKNARRGRPIAVARSAPFPDARPNILATLRAAAPWQVIRHRNRAALLSRIGDRNSGRIKQPKALITRDDYRFQRLRHETPSTAIFMVDASGSTALERLGETKGAIEQLLSRCYVRRDEVAMIAFRGRTAETVLPPTRSLVMAKRKLAGLPGGGPTPLVSGLEKGLELALSVRQHGSTPVMVLLTDGRGNIARNGDPDRTRAQEELGRVAGQYRAHDMRSICIDIARRPRDAVASLADKMGADLHFLRQADAGSMSDLVNASLEEARG